MVLIRALLDVMLNPKLGKWILLERETIHIILQIGHVFGGNFNIQL